MFFFNLLPYILSVLYPVARLFVALRLTSCGCWYSVSLPRCVVGWSAVCDCGIFRSCTLYF